MKNLKTKMFSLLIILGLIFTQNVIFAEGSSNQEMYPIYLTDNLSEPCSEISTNSVDKDIKAIEIDSAKLYDVNNMKIKGTFNNKKFALDGKLKKGRKEEIIAKLNDLNDNFKCIFFSIDKDPSKKLSFNNKVFDKVEKFGVKLYLQDKETKEYIIFEIADPEFINEELFFKDINKYEESNFEDRHWYIGEIEPKREILEMSDLSERELEILDMKNEVKIKSNTNISSTPIIHRYFYSVSGGKVTEYIKLEFELVGMYRLLQNGEHDIQANLELVKEYTDASWEDEIEEDSSLRIGRWKKTRFDACLFSSKAKIKKAEASAVQYTSTGSINFSFGWGLPIFPGSPVYITGDYKYGETKSDGDFVNFNSYQGGIGFEKGMQLANKEDKFHTNFTISGESKTGKDVKFGVRLQYDVSSSLDPYWGDEDAYKERTLKFDVVE
ncbi:hypothetical protein PV797_01790 [Clostridiaceae bacterium M8S5]|nr:hypothetical protein PV797_01790 [Clostridiaceae bacterium M8S5]